LHLPGSFNAENAAALQCSLAPARRPAFGKFGDFNKVLREQLRLLDLFLEATFALDYWQPT
jgi:hypothetical protein